MIPTIGLASGVGGKNIHAAAGPLFLQNHLKGDLSWKTVIIPEKTEVKDPYETIAALNRKLADAAYSMAKQEPFFLSVGGDHSCAIGMWSGVSAAKQTQGPLGLLWIDAHMDSHTPQTTETGNIHGMPLAVLMGHGDSRLTQIFHCDPKIRPQHIALIGIRSFERGEARLLSRLNVRVYFMEEVRTRGIRAVLQEALSLVCRNTIGFGVSFDLDSLDPLEIKAVATPEPGGVDSHEMLSAFSLFEKFPPIAFELVEYTPSLDSDFNTLKFIRRLLKTIKPVSTALNAQA